MEEDIVQRCLLEAATIIQEYETVWFDTGSKTTVQLLIECDAMVFGALIRIDRCRKKGLGKRATYRTVGNYLLASDISADTFYKAIRRKGVQLPPAKVRQDKARLCNLISTVLETISNTLKTR